MNWWVLLVNVEKGEGVGWRKGDEEHRYGTGIRRRVVVLW